MAALVVLQMCYMGHNGQSIASNDTWGSLLWLCVVHWCPSPFQLQHKGLLWLIGWMDILLDSARRNVVTIKDIAVEGMTAFWPVSHGYCHCYYASDQWAAKSQQHTDRQTSELREIESPAIVVGIINCIFALVGRREEKEAIICPAAYGPQRLSFSRVFDFPQQWLLSNVLYRCSCVCFYFFIIPQYKTTKLGINQKMGTRFLWFLFWNRLWGAFCVCLGRQGKENAAHLDK